MLFKVFHRTLEFNLLLSISLITVSFLAFFNKWYYFASSSIKRHSLDSPLFERPFLSRSRSLIAVRISSESHDGFFIDLTLTDLSGACQSTTSSTRASQVDNISSGSLSKVSRTVQGTSFKSLMRLLTFNFFKGRDVTVNCAFFVDFKFAVCLWVGKRPRPNWVMLKSFQYFKSFA